MTPPAEPAASETRPLRWQDRLFHGGVLVLLLLPLPFLANGPSADPAVHIDVLTHAVVELFCGATALLIAVLMFALSRQHHERAMRVFALAFLLMGVLDVLHAATPPAAHPRLFVLFHTLSILCGAVLLSAGVIRYYRAHHVAVARAELYGELLFVLAMLGAVVFAYHVVLPAGRPDSFYDFSGLARRLHELAGLLYAGAAALAFLHYRRTRLRLVLVVAGMLLLFAESAYMFRFSHVWDSTWWAWHAIKVAFYVGTLVVIAAGLVRALRAVEYARQAEAAANRELQRAHGALRGVLRELRIRNRMVNASISARGLPQTLTVVETALVRLLGPCRFQLWLRAAEGEEDEWRGELLRQGLPWEVTVSARGPGHGAVASPGRGAGRDCLCLGLRAHGQVFGHLLVYAGGAALTAVRRAQVGTLAAEIGPVIHNAVLHDRWREAIAFRSGLTRVAVLLGASLELPRVLDAVCAEGAKLLGSDGAAVFLVDGSTGAETLRLAGHCAPGDAGAAPPEWPGGGSGHRLLADLGAAGGPITFLNPPPAGEAGRRAPEMPGCRWGAMAVLPLLDGGTLSGALVLMREGRVRYSRATLEKGELLAEQIRVAVANARAYEALRLSNGRLRRAEEEKLRSERLAVLGRMTVSVAHEVRNPLSSISNCLAVLRRAAPLTPPGESALEIIDDEVQRLERLTRNFLSFGRPQRQARRAVRLERLVARACEAVERHVGHEGLAVAVRCEARGAFSPIDFDADGLQELLWNLLLNAVQAVRGEGRVRVRVAQRRDRFFIAVADNGPGVPLADRARIFEPFYSQRPEGAGLGLAIVRQRVESWGGRLRVWGPPGACFTLLCRAAPAAVAAEALAGEAS